MTHIDLSTLFITHDIDEAILLSDRIYILNGTPGEIKDEIVIHEQKPRPDDFYLTETFLNYKRDIIRHGAFSYRLRWFPFFHRREHICQKL